ncbi:unnamed protein product [Parnassius apollo]|uniref:receptor protein-tyrosine kinase n=1 Tax=Parnassius apollo TaxID=110799 RepID=A0A8S3XYM5_PARAO|nr:unnamed protein product [Parnassius apollo]
MFTKMHEFLRITLVCLCAILLAVHDGRCEEDVVSSDASVESEVITRSDDAEQGKESKSSFLPGSARKTTTQSSANTTRDSQLLSLLAARRRQLLSGRLTTHINTLATLAHKPHKGNTTFAQLEIRDSNSSIVKRITFDNSSNELSPTLKLVASDGAKEIRQDVKPHEIRHLFIPKIYQENKNRAGFINNRRRDLFNINKTVIITISTTESGVVYVPPDKLEGSEKEVDLDPDEEFQVDESNHGLYLLNYSDTENVTQNLLTVSEIKTSNDVKEKDNTTPFSVPTTQAVLISNVTLDANVYFKDEKPETNTIANSTDIQKLPDDEMAPFIFFGQKLGGPIISDNLTNSPSLSASTKSVNFIVAPPEKRKFNSRYSATEKYKNTNAGEDEINEDMDVSVVKNVIEKNKIRNTVKGPAPARPVGLVNAYRKYSSTTQTTLKSPNIAELYVTEPVLQNVTPSSFGNMTIYNNTLKETVKHNVNITKDASSNRTATNSAPKNFTRSYFNLRRRPAKVSASSTESVTATTLNATTEKASTSVYTAVVTSVSITSSMKGQNKTDNMKGSENDTIVDIVNDNINATLPKELLINDNKTSTIPPTTARPYRHRIRIRTTTTESSFNPNPVQTLPAVTLKPNPLIISEFTTKIPDTQATTTAKLPEQLASFNPQKNYDNSSYVSTAKPRNILRRRRPTTTTTKLPMVTKNENILTISIPTTTLSPVSTSTHGVVIATISLNDNSKTSLVSGAAPVFISKNVSKIENNTTVVNTTRGKDTDNVAQNEEVVIEAEKTYTASYVLAGLGFLPVGAVIAFFLRNFLNKKTKEIDTEYEGYFNDGEIKKESPITPVARPPISTPSKPDQKWEFPRNKLRLQTLLGEGNFGQVWKAEADDLNGHDGLTRLVAVKTIKESASQKEKQELLHEIYIMQKIGTHPNVVTLLACCTEQEPYLLIMEYVMCGKLLTYLRARRSRPDRFGGGGALASRDLTVFAYCVARGMEYIASKGIVHRDLAARNVLVDHNKLCKIADFGMSRCAGGGARAARGALPVRWMAPEALLYNVCNHQTDVWAFGILLWEIVTLGSTPYAAMSGREVLAAVTEGYRLERPPHCKPQLYRAMHSCWHADPSQRPTFASLKAQLAELLDNEPSEGNYVDLDSFYQESSVYSDPSAIINDEDGLSAEYDRERRCFRELANGPSQFDNRAFNLRDEELRNKFGIGTPRMGGFGIRDVTFNDRNFSDGEFNDRKFPDKNFTDRNFTDQNFNDPNFTERKDGKLSTSSFHRERERENPLVSRNSFNGFPRVGTRDNHFQINPDGRNKRVSEFECDI